MPPTTAVLLDSVPTHEPASPAASSTPAGRSVERWLWPCSVRCWPTARHLHGRPARQPADRRWRCCSPPPSPASASRSADSHYVLLRAADAEPSTRRPDIPDGRLRLSQRPSSKERQHEDSHLQRQGRHHGRGAPQATVSEPTDAVVRVVLACVCGSDLWFYRGISEPAARLGRARVHRRRRRGRRRRHDAGRRGLRDLAVLVERRHLQELRGRLPHRLRARRFLRPGRRGRRRPGRVRARAAGRRHAGQGPRLGLLRRDHGLAAGADRRDGTGYHAAVSAGVKPGTIVAVVGDGAVGLSGVLSAKMLGAERIIVLGSTTESRHALAREWGATDIITVRGEDAVEQLQDLTGGYGADAVLECVGTKESTTPPSRLPRPVPSSAVSACRTTPRSMPRQRSTATSACAAAPLPPATTSPSC